MFAHELRDMLIGKTENFEYIENDCLEGEVFFIDEKGNKHQINFIEIEDGNVIFKWKE